MSGLPELLRVGLIEPWRYDFFVRAMAAATLAGALCGLVGCFIILRRMSYVGHGLANSIFGGAIVSSALGWPFYAGAGAWGIASAVLISWLGRWTRVGADAAIGIVTTASFAIGVAIVSRSRRFTPSISATLFGNVLGVQAADILAIAVVAVLVVVAIAAAYRSLAFATFDPEVAPAYGIPLWQVDLLLATCLGATIVVATQALGVTLVAAMAVVPPVTARLVTQRLSTMLPLAAMIGAACGAVGLFASYWLDVASGATIVLTATVAFGVVATGHLRPTSRSRTDRRVAWPHPTRPD